MWQDTVIAIAQIAFIPAMWPALRGQDKPPTSTSVMNAAIVSVIAFSLATLKLWFAFSTALCIAFIWTILAVQKVRIDRRPVPDEVNEKS